MEVFRFDGAGDSWNMQAQDIIGENMVQHFHSPGFTGISRLDSIQCLEPMKETYFGNVNEKSGACPVFSDALISGTLSSPSVLNRAFLNSSSLDEFQIPGFGIGNEATGSLESLECLLSTTNSNTDNASVEDDGISMIFSDFCTQSFQKNNGSSTGGSACFVSTNKDSNNHFSADQHKKPMNIRKHGKKRNHDDILMKPGENLEKFSLFQSNSSRSEVGFQLIQETQQKPNKIPRSEKTKHHPSSSNINFQQPSSISSLSSLSMEQEPDSEAIAQMKEMIYRAAAFRPVNLANEVVEKPRRKNVRISSDPQTVAARERRERISERIRVLQKIVPGGNKMDTATMLDEAANYLKFLRSQVKELEIFGNKISNNISFPLYNSFPVQYYYPGQNPNPLLHHPRS